MRLQFSSAGEFQSSALFVGAAALPVGTPASARSVLARSSSSAHVAILLAVKDGARFLPEQLESYLQQTHRNWSVHVSDDGSIDKTVEVVQDFARRVSNLVTLRDGPCTGFNTNFLSLLRDPNIDADYFAFSDQDDVWCPDKLERALNLLMAQRGDQPALYCSRTELIDHAGRHVGLSMDFKKPPNFRNALVQNIAGGNTMVFNRAARQLLKKATDEHVIIHDWMSYIIVSGAGGAIFYDRKPSVRYRQHENNIIGANVSASARLRRVKMLLRGQWQEWSSLHLQVLERLLPDMTKENRKVLEDFVLMRRADRLPQRCWHLWKSGVHRQTLLGQIGLLVAVMLRKI